MHDFLVGLDLGQVHDYTAIAIAERPLWIGPEPSDTCSAIHSTGPQGWTRPSELLPVKVAHFRALNLAGHRPGKPPLYVRHLERMVGRSYQHVVDRVAELMAAAPLANADTVLLVDQTGVGRAVFDMLMQAGLRPIGITITAGSEAHGDAYRELWVPKADLIMSCQVMLQNGRLRIARGLPDAAVLTKELLDYRVQISPSGRDTFNARSGAHDDALLAVAMIAWYRDWESYHFDAAHAAAKRQQTG